MSGATWEDVRRAALERLDPDERGFWRLKFDFLSVTAIVAAGVVFFGSAEQICHTFWWLNGTNLLIHEAGHPIVGLLFLGNTFMTAAGGTLFQLFVPLVFYCSFLARGQFRSADLMLFWFGENFLAIAPYAADARARVLPLVGGGEHDWTYMLGALGLLELDAQIGQLFYLTGCLVMVFALYALVAHWRMPAPRRSFNAALWGE